MPAGDLILLDHQVEIRATLTGQGTLWPIAWSNLEGLGVPAPKTADVKRDLAAGAYLAADYGDIRIITIPYVLRGTPAAVGANFLTLSTAWAVSLTDIPLVFRLPGFGRRSVTGRPRGLVDDLSDLNSGVIRALATFVCGDPTMTVV